MKLNRFRCNSSKNTLQTFNPQSRSKPSKDNDSDINSFQNMSLGNATKSRRMFKRKDDSDEEDDKASMNNIMRDSYTNKGYINLNQ